MKAAARGATDTGRKRDHNEDYLLIDSDLGLHIVCDGVGGGLAGEIASQTAAKVIHRVIHEGKSVLEAYATRPDAATRGQAVALVESAVTAANTHVYQMGEKDPQKKGMGTTVVMCVTAGSHGIIAHVGDSRAYLARAGKHYQLTEDHSLLHDMLKKGLITPEAAENSQFAHVITRAVGTHEALEVDMLHIELVPGDLFLLCSDGLSDHFKKEEFLEYSKSEWSSLPTRLIQFANDRGGHDNVSALIVRIEGDAATQTGVAADLEKRIDAIRQIPLFRYLSFAELNKVLGVVTLKPYKAGETIIVEGSKGDEMFIILSGKVDVKKKGKTLATLEKGNFFGEMQLVDDVPRSASIIAADASVLMAISRKDFYPMLRREQQMTVKLLWEFCQVLNSRLRTLNELFVGAKDLPESKAGPNALPFVVPGE